MNRVGIKFLLDSGHYIQAIVDVEWARKIVKDFGQNALPMMGTISCDNGISPPFALKVSALQAIHLFDPVALGTTPMGTFNKSGIIGGM
jgi:hypothetical protein